MKQLQEILDTNKLEIKMKNEIMTKQEKYDADVAEIIVFLDGMIENGSEAGFNSYMLMFPDEIEETK